MQLQRLALPFRQQAAVEGAQRTDLHAAQQPVFRGFHLAQGKNSFWPVKGFVLTKLYHYTGGKDACQGIFLDIFPFLSLPDVLFAKNPNNMPLRCKSTLDK